MTGKASRERRKEAVEAAKETVYHGTPMPDDFDERQERIYEEYVGKLGYSKSMYDWLEM